MNTQSMMLYRGDYMAYVTPVNQTPAGQIVYRWEVQDLTDVDNRANFASGHAVGEELVVLECASAARAHRNA